jgi:hypothetical protein
MGKTDSTSEPAQRTALCAVSEQLALGSDNHASERNAQAKGGKAAKGSKPTFLWLIRDHQVPHASITALLPGFLG